MTMRRVRSEPQQESPPGRWYYGALLAAGTVAVVTGLLAASLIAAVAYVWIGLSMIMLAAWTAIRQGGRK